MTLELPSPIDIKMMTGEIVVAIVSLAATSCLIALRKSKCFIRKIRGGLEWGLGFTEKPLLVNELPPREEKYQG